MGKESIMELAKTQCYEFECFEDNYSAGRDVGLTQGRLRAILCKNQAKWEMKNFNPPSPPQILHAIRYCGGMSKNAPLVA